MSGMDRLLPCPFCGGLAFMANEHDPDGNGKFYFIKCQTCRARGAEFYASDTCPIFFAQVRDVWNRRASQAAPVPSDGLREAWIAGRDAARSCCDTYGDPMTLCNCEMTIDARCAFPPALSASPAQEGEPRHD